MPNTYTDYSATANQTSFSYSFSVLLASHVAVEIDGVSKTYNTDYTVDKTTSVVTLQLGGVVGAGATAGALVRVRRLSDPATDLVDFADGSRLSASRLDLAYQHNRYLNEEASEISDGAIGETTVGGTTFLNATDREIRNLATPTTDNSAVSKKYVDDQQALSGINMTAFGQDDYTGDGTTTAFTFISITPQVTDSKAFLVNIDGITQSPSSYTISNTGIVFTTAPVSSSVITVVTLAGAAITAPVDGVTTELKTGNKIGVKNGGIDNDKLAGGITQDKLAGLSITNSELAGSITQDKLAGLSITNSELAGSIATSKLAEVIDDATFTTGVSATSLASSESIKAYVDNNSSSTPNNRNKIKILSADFINNGLMLNGTFTSAGIFSAQYEIPQGYKATEVVIYAEYAISGRYNVTVSEGNINSNTLTSKGTSGRVTGNTTINITDVGATTLNYLDISFTEQQSSQTFYGGYITLAEN